jgi:phospholipid-translocating P-type ATPase (flippase)
MAEEETDGTSRVIWANCPELNRGFTDNRVKTTKYNLVTFLPFSLFLQFRRVSNIYFLITAILQSIPQISPLQPFTAIAPLVFVLAVSMIREAIEEYLRYKSDREINNSPTLVYRKGSFQEVCFMNISVGDLVMVKKNEVFPCDIVMLSNSSDNFTAYIETSSLDGEKALKPRQAFIHTAPLLSSTSHNRVLSLLKCEHPNSRLYNYSGTYDFCGTTYPLDKAHLLLAGAFLRNTEWAIGIAVYTGSDTKLRQNMMKRKYKESQIDRMTNKYIGIVIVLQFCLCMACAIASGYWVSDHMREHSYIRYDKSYSIQFKGGAQGTLGYFTYFLLLNTMLPISLIVTLELLKLMQGFFMMMDLTMYSEKRDRPCKVSSFSLNEELGMIKHVFSDKTGTLTCNQMEFKFFCTGNRIYGEQSVLVNLGLKTKVTFEDREIKYTFNDKNVENDLFSNEHFPLRFPYKHENVAYSMETQKELASMMVRCLALCHECVLEYDNEEITYTGPSPDDVVLVDTARRIGFTLSLIKSEVLTLSISSQLHDDTFSETYKRICILEFNSFRSRMSVVLYDQQEKRYLIFMKGSDSKMLPRLSQWNNTEYVAKIKEYIDTFARRGFRTLVMAMKFIPEDEFRAWKARYDDAATQINDRQAAVDRVADELEVEMQLLGCTAVEDALQDDVPDTINDLLRAGVSFWMLTGDKLETAENIGKTCTLINDNMVVEKCATNNPQNCCKRMEEALQHFKNQQNEKELALIIEGSALEVVLSQQEDGGRKGVVEDEGAVEDSARCAKKAKECFLEMSDMCKTIICCRVSPSQKKDVVKLVKDYSGKVTLSIGDGANDVPMILEAHIGVGLYGEEGIQAVQASDYALGEFRYLWELLLIHGRFNYIRQSEMILYFFYKNLIFTFPQFLFANYCAYSGQTVYDDWYLTFYNLVFTALPLFVRALLEKDFIVPKRWECSGSNFIEEKKELREKIPTVYRVGSENQLFTLPRFVLWLGNGIFHALIVFFIPLYASEEGIIDEKGRNYDLWTFSIASFSSIIIIVNIKIGINTKLWTRFHYSSIFGFSIALYFIFLLIYDVVTYTPSLHTFYTLLGTHYYYFCILATTSLVCALDVAMTIITKLYYPTESDKMLKFSKKKPENEEGKSKKHRKENSNIVIEKNVIVKPSREQFIVKSDTPEMLINGPDSDRDSNYYLEQNARDKVNKKKDRDFLE